MKNTKTITSVGRRKESTAQIRMVPGTGKITVNGKDVREFFPYETNVMDLKQPLVLTNTEEVFDIEVKTDGGGFTGQTGAIRLAITKGLLEYDIANEKDKENGFRNKLKKAGFITRDARIKERKKPGLKKARRAPQFSKR